LIALLADIGFEGFEENENVLSAYMNETSFDEADFAVFAVSNNLSYSLAIIEQQNWNAQWESSFEPVIINDFAAVRAGFHQPVPEVKYDIVITPKMSFGTGHHATTYLVMEQMSQLDFNNKTVLDFGTGTAVLAILAEKMGAVKVKAIDNDDWSIDNAKENISQNNTLHIDIEKASAITVPATYDIILANINLNVILQSMAVMAAVCKPGAVILLSGFLVDDEAAIKASLADNQLVFKGLTQKNGWICIRAERP
jgi:ribosomal protein L11 methyltransferase